MDTCSCTAELKPMMVRSRNSRHEIIRSAEQFPFMTIMREEDLIFGLRTLRTLISSPVTEIRIIRHPIDKLASIQMATEIQTLIDSITKTDHATLGTTDPTIDSKLSITLMLDQRTQTLNTIKTFHRTTIYLHPTQFNLSTIEDKM